MRTLLTLALALALVACAGPSPSTAPSFDVGTPTAIHLDTLVVAHEGFIVEKPNEVYAHVTVAAYLADPNGPLALGNTLPEDVICWFHDDGLPTSAGALGSPALCGWTTYIELPKGRKKAASFTVTFDSATGDGYLYAPGANTAPTTVTLQLR